MNQPDLRTYRWKRDHRLTVGRQQIDRAALDRPDGARVRPHHHSPDGQVGWVVGPVVGAVEGASGAGGEAGVFRVAHEGVGLGACEGEMSAVQCIGAESVEDRVGPGGVVFVLPRGDQQAVAAAVVD